MIIYYCSFKSSQVTSQGTRTATTSRSGNQCCYDFGGNLIPPGKLGAGTVDLVSPEVDKWTTSWRMFSLPLHAAGLCLQTAVHIQNTVQWVIVLVTNLLHQVTHLSCVYNNGIAYRIAEKLL